PKEVLTKVQAAKSCAAAQQEWEIWRKPRLFSGDAVDLGKKYYECSLSYLDALSPARKRSLFATTPARQNEETPSSTAAYASTEPAGMSLYVSQPGTAEMAILWYSKQVYEQDKIVKGQNCPLEGGPFGIRRPETGDAKVINNDDLTKLLNDLALVTIPRSVD